MSLELEKKLEHFSCHLQKHAATEIPSATKLIFLTPHSLGKDYSASFSGLRHFVHRQLVRRQICSGRPFHLRLPSVCSDESAIKVVWLKTKC